MDVDPPDPPEARGEGDGGGAFGDGGSNGGAFGGGGNGGGAAGFAAGGPAPGAGVPPSGGDAGGGVQSFNVLGTRFECPPRYTLIRPIGQGAYGVVCSAMDNATGRKVAIKKIANIVDNETDCKRTLREMRLLRHFRHENVIAISDVYVPAADGMQFSDVYTVTELMDTDLHQIITSGQELSDEHCQYFLYQILKALKHIHSASVLHRDLKPSNILINGNCDLKICDFGLARVADPAGDANNLTAYVATRWYRAPEIIILSKNYGPAVDVWSVGCILAEILGRRPLFPGRDYIHQLSLVIDLIGTPSARDMEHIHLDRARKFIEEHLPQTEPKRLSEVFPAAPSALLDLLAQMLVFDPAGRITVEAALRHPYLADLHDAEAEPDCDQAFDFDFNQGPIPKDQLRGLIFEELLLYHPELR